MIIKDSFSEREIELIETIGLYLHDGEYEDYEITVLDNLTYAADMDNLKNCWGKNDFGVFVKDICDKDEMANLEEGSDAFLEVANKAGEVKHQLDEINESIKGASADFGDMIGNVTNVAAGITGAFQAVAGGLQAMGIESKAIDETIVRMQGLMAVTQGLSAIDEGVKSFDKLTKSLGKAGETLGAFVKGLGKIAAPVAIVTALGLAFAKLKERIDGTNAALKEREEAQRIFNSELEREIPLYAGPNKTSKSSPYFA